MNIDQAISALRKRKEVNQKVDPSLTNQALLQKLNNNLIGAIADVAQAFYDKKPHEMKMDHSPMIEAIKGIPKTDVTPVVKAIKEIKPSKEVDITPVVRAINNIPVPEAIDFSPVITAIKQIKEAPKEIKVLNQIDLDRVEELLSRLVKLYNAPKTVSEVRDDKLIIEELRNLSETLVESINDNKTDFVRVLNPGDFPVSPSVAAFKKSDGTVGAGLVDSDGNVQIDVLTSGLPTGASTSANQVTANTLLQGIAGFTPSEYDFVSLSYTGANLTGVIFKTGGSGGTTISTLVLGYDGSDNLTSVTKT